MAPHDREADDKPEDLKDNFLFKRLCQELEKLSPDRLEEAMGYIEEQAQKEPVMLKTEDFAALMGVTAETVRGWLRTGKIRGTKIGKRYFISKEELSRLTE